MDLSLLEGWLCKGLEVVEPPSIDGLRDEPIHGAGVVGGEELEPQLAEPPARSVSFGFGSVQEALNGASQGAHGAALVPPDFGLDICFRAAEIAI